MEVLFAGFDPTDGQDLGGIMVVDSTRQSSWKRAVGDRLLGQAAYATAEGRASAVAFEDLDDLDALLSLPALAGAAAELNQWLRLNAQVPSLQSQWHVPEFTEWVLDNCASG